ncbi:unnamed protein product [Parnassius apollo]|uniref:(apollo) hypothetical protein n=1 Tax=Parnassius apollo TaxID=110799 RepID=A0A8S3X6X4_PARAO|nr:unnamed protein product [Parnassius apollo]
MECGACRHIIENGGLIKCAGCDNMFHYECCNIEKQVYFDEYMEKKQKWYCPSYTNITRRKNHSTPVGKRDIRSLQASQANISNMSCDKKLQRSSRLKKSSNSASQHALRQKKSDSVTIEQIEALLDRKLSTFKIDVVQEVHTMVTKEFNHTINKLESDFTVATDFLQKGQDGLLKELEVANNKIKALELERTTLKSNIESLDRRLMSVEKISRSHNVEIQMVLEKCHENLLQLIQKLYDTVNVTLDTNCICAVRRIAKINPKTDRPRNILLTLQTERQRDILLSAVKRYNKTNHPNHLNSTCLGIEGEYRAIYVNEHLSSTTKKLYAEAGALTW